MDGRSDYFSRLHFVTGWLLEILFGQIGINRPWYLSYGVTRVTNHCKGS